MYGDSIGIVTWRKHRHEPAPSIRAASYSDSGMPCRPASQIIIPLPAPHSPMRMIEGFDHIGSVSHGGLPMCSAPRMQLIAPLCGLSTHSHRIELATAGTIAGR